LPISHGRLPLKKIAPYIQPSNRLWHFAPGPVSRVGGSNRGVSSRVRSVSWRARGRRCLDRGRRGCSRRSAGGRPALVARVSEDGTRTRNRPCCGPWGEADCPGRPMSAYRIR
jgi:hypothetical protein